MAKVNKVFHIMYSSHRGNVEYVMEGTIESLLNRFADRFDRAADEYENYHKYYVVGGLKWEGHYPRPRKVSRNPKTIKQILTALNNSTCGSWGHTKPPTEFYLVGERRLKDGETFDHEEPIVLNDHDALHNGPVDYFVC